MTRKASWLAPGKITVTLAVLAALLGFGLPSQTWAAVVDSSTQTVTAVALPVTGTPTSSNGGVAVPGSAMAMNFVPTPVQVNVQVDTSSNPSNNLQTATNNATLDLATGAISGNPNATNGGTAATGAAMATSTAIVMQVNVQVIMGNTPIGGVTQTAANETDIDMMTLAGTGNSGADGVGSNATTGAAAASNSAVVNQANWQVYDGIGGGVDTAGSVQQSLMNNAGVSQAISSLSGIASAASGGQSSTGAVQNTAQHMLQQGSTQTVNE
jgi:hypothetical protein